MTAEVTIKARYHPQQKQVAESPARFKVIAAGRRWGKTRLGVTECMEVAKEGGRAWWIAPTYRIGMEGWRPLVRIARQIPGTKIRAMDQQVEFPGGGVIEVRSAKPGTLIGAGLDLVVVDEAAYIPGEDWWTEDLRPTLSSPGREGRAMFISTPRGYGNLFYRLWDAAEKREGWERFQFPSTGNPFFDADEIELERPNLGSLVIAQVYLGEFVEMGGTIINADWFCYFEDRTRADDIPFYDKLTDKGTVAGSADTRDGIRFVTVDLAVSTKTSADFTVICNGHSIGGDLFITDIDRARRPAPDIIPAIEKRLPAGAVAHIERAGFQLAIIQMAQDAGLPVKELVADRDKLARALPLAARMEAGRVWFKKDAPWLGELERELLAFTGGQQAEHDDQVDALAYAVRVAGETKRVRVDLSGWDMSDMIQT